MFELSHYHLNLTQLNPYNFIIINSNFYTRIDINGYVGNHLATWNGSSQR